MKIAIPKSKTKLIDKNNPWWTPGLQTRRKQVNKLYRTSKRFPTDANINKYKIAQAEYAKSCDKTRNTAWNAWHKNFTTLTTNTLPKCH